MGDMAEYALQQDMDNYASGDEERDGYTECEYGPRPKTCRQRREKNLWWDFQAGKYRLIDAAGKLHVCPVAALNAAARKVFEK